MTALLSAGRKYAWKPDVPDHRDFYYTLPQTVSLPDHVDRLGSSDAVDDQGQLGSCTGCASTTAIEIILKGGEYSRLMAYWNGRQLEGTTGLDAGAQIRDVIKGITKYGVCTENLWPYTISKFRQKPPATAYSNGLTLLPKIKSYNRVTDLAGVKHSLASGIPVVFGFAVPDYFESQQVATTGWVRLPTVSDQMIGGHAVVAVGYDDRNANKKFIWVRNSWSAQWGIQGHFQMDQGWFTDPRRLVDDMWAIIPN